MSATTQVPVEILSNMALALVWAGGAGVLGLLIYAWKELRARVDLKVDLTEHMHLKEDVAKLNIRFDKLDGEMEKSLETDRVTSIQLVKIDQQISRLVGHADSEQRTRIESIARLERQFDQIGRDWVGEIRALRHAMTSTGRRKSDPPETLP